MVSKAMAVLVDDGLIYRRRHSGTIVADVDPHDVARSCTQTIGLVFANVTGAFMNDIIMGIQDDLYRRDYHTFLCDCNNEVEREVKHIDSLVDRGVDGLLVYPVARRRGMPNSYSHYRRLLRSRIPFVFLERYHKNIDTDCVVFDYYAGARQAMSHLVELGHRKIAFLAVPSNTTSLADRLRGYKDGLREFGIKPDPGLIKYCDPSALMLEAIVEDLIKHDVSAIICFSDVFAYRVFRILNAKGINVPQDISLVGFGKRDTELIYPELTTVSRSAYELGQKAAGLLFDKVSSGGRDVMHISLDTELAVGGSTAAAKVI